MAESARAELAQASVYRRRDQPLGHRLTHDRPLDPAAVAAYLQQTTGNRSLNRLIEARQQQASDEAQPAETDGSPLQRDLAAPAKADTDELVQPMVGGLEQALATDPDDRSGAVRQRLGQVPPELREPILNQLKPRVPDATWLAKPEEGIAATHPPAESGTVDDGAAASLESADGHGAAETLPASAGGTGGSESATAAGPGASKPVDETSSDRSGDVEQGLSQLGDFAAPPPQAQTPPAPSAVAASSNAGSGSAATGAPSSGSQPSGAGGGVPQRTGGQAGAGAAGPKGGGPSGAAKPGSASAGKGGAPGGPGGAGTVAGPTGPSARADSAGGTSAGASDGVASASTASLALVDVELAEHQRWGSASTAVGAAGSEQRAEFVAQQVGAGLLGGFVEGGEQGLALGLVESFSPVPGVGAIIGGVQALEGLKGQAAHAAEAVHNFGEGSDTYEVLANSIAAVSAVIDVVTGVLGVFNGILGVIEVALWAITAGAAIAAIVTAGATAAIAAMAGEAAEVVTDIKEVVGVVMLALSGINSVILQPVVLLFRAMHTMTSQADPRAVEAQGAGLKQSAGAVGGFLGGLAGAAVAGEVAPEEEGAPPKPVEEEAPPPAPASEGPTVSWEEPNAGTPEGGASPERSSGGSTSDQPGEADVEPQTQPRPGTPGEVDVEPPTEPRPSTSGEEPSPYAEEPRIGFGREPGPGGLSDEPRIGFGREPGPEPGAPPSPYGEEPHIGFGREPAGGSQSGEVDVEPETLRNPSSGEPVEPEPETVRNPTTSVEENPVPGEMDSPPTREGDGGGGGGGGDDEGGGGAGGGEDNSAHNAADFERLKAQYAMEEIMGAEPVGSATKGGSGDVRSNQVIHDVEIELPDGTKKTVPKPLEGVRNVSMDVDANHSAPIFEQPRIAEDGRVFPLKGADGSQKNLTQMPGEVNGQPGIHEYIVDQNGNLVHQQFIPGGSVTGEPGGRPPRPTPPGPSGTPGGGGPVPGGGGPEPTGGGPAPAGGQDTPGPPVNAEGPATPAPADDATSTPPADDAVAPPVPADDTATAPAAATSDPAAPQDPAAQPPERSNSQRLQGARAQARAQAIAEIREAIQSGIAPNERVAYAMERIKAVYGADALVEFGETGVPPPGMEFGHLFSAAEYPEFAADSDVGVLTDRRDHRIGHHDNDTGVPLHGEPRNPDWEQDWGSQEGDLSSEEDRAYAGMTGDEPPPSVDSELAHDYPELFNQSGDTRGGSGGSTPSGSRPPSGSPAPPTGDNAPPGAQSLNAADASVRNGEPLTQEEFAKFSAQAQQMGMPADQIHQVQGPTAYGPAFDQLVIGPDVKPLPAELRPPDLANPANAAMGPTEVLSHEIIGHREAALAGQEHPLPWAEEAQASFRAALHGDLTPEQRQMLIQDASSRFRYQDPNKPGTVYMYMERGSSGGGGAPSAKAGAAGSGTSQGSTPGKLGSAAVPAAGTSGSGGDHQASVEPVNPNYSPPPGTPQQLKQMQADISQTLADRARADQAKARMDAERAKHQANVGPAQQAIQGTQAGITATQAHQQDVALRDQANKQQQAKQQESQSTIGGYADKAAGLSALSVPLAAFRGFTSLASHLPGDAGAAMAKMNTDGQKVTEAFEQMGVKMAEQAAGMPQHQQGLESDNARIQASGQQGQDAAADLQTAQQGAQAFQQANESKIQQATAGASQAAGEESKLDASAKTKTQKASTLAEQLQAWATEHKASRQKAVEDTRQQLQAKGKVVTAVKED